MYKTYSAFVGAFTQEPGLEMPPGHLNTLPPDTPILLPLGCSAAGTEDTHEIFFFSTVG